MNFSERGNNALQYFYNLSRSEQLAAAGFALAGLATIAGMAIGAKENYRGIEALDCFGNQTVYVESGQAVDEVVTDAAETIAVSPNNVDALARIFLYDNPTAVAFDDESQTLVIQEGIQSVTIPERCS